MAIAKKRSVLVFVTLLSAFMVCGLDYFEDDMTVKPEYAYTLGYSTHQNLYTDAVIPIDSGTIEIGRIESLYVAGPSTFSGNVTADANLMVERHVGIGYSPSDDYNLYIRDRTKKDASLYIYDSYCNYGNALIKLRDGAADARIMLEEVCPDNGGDGHDRLYIDMQESDLPMIYISANRDTYPDQLFLRYDGKVGIGTESPDQTFSVNGDASKAGGGSWQTFSDIRLKDVVDGFDRGLDEITKISPFMFRYKEGNPMGYDPSVTYVGVSAQDVEDVIPEAVSAADNGYLTFDQDPVFWAALNAIKELKDENDKMKNDLAALSAIVCADHPQAEICD